MVYRDSHTQYIMHISYIIDTHFILKDLFFYITIFLYILYFILYMIFCFFLFLNVYLYAIYLYSRAAVPEVTGVGWGGVSQDTEGRSWNAFLKTNIYIFFLIIV